MLYVLAIVILLLVGLVKYSLARLTYPETWTRHDHSGPKTYPHVDPFLGLDLAIQTWQEFNRGELSEGLRRRHLVHGPTYITRNLGSDCIYTIEPDNIRTITTRDFDKYGKSGWVEEAAKHVGNGILMNEGEAWKHSRVMLKPIFSRSVMSEPMLLEPHVRSLVDSMRHSSAQGNGVFDFHELASMFTLDVVTEFLFGKSTDCLENPRGPDGQDGVHFLSLVKEFEGPSGKFIAIGPLAWLGLLPKYRRLIGLVEGMKAFFRRKLCEIVIEANNCPFVPIRGMPRLLEVSPSVFRSMKRAGVSDDRIQGELRNIFFASYDTTSTFLANLVYVLVRHPDVQQRLRQEIASLEGRLPSQRDLGKMGYVRLVIMEGLFAREPLLSVHETPWAVCSSLIVWTLQTLLWSVPVFWPLPKSSGHSYVQTSFADCVPSPSSLLPCQLPLTHRQSRYDPPSRIRLRCTEPSLRPGGNDHCLVYLLA